MTRAHVCLIVLLAFLSGPVGCREPNRSFQSSEKEESTSKNNSQSTETSVSTKEPVLIYLAIGSFDPLFQTSPVDLPQELTLQRYPRRWDRILHIAVQRPGFAEVEGRGSFGRSRYF